MADRASYDFLALTQADSEEMVLRHCAEALQEHGMRDGCYFDRYRANHAHGIALHWRADADPAQLTRVLDDIVARVASAPGKRAVQFVPFIENARAALSGVFGGRDSVDTFRAFSFDTAPLLWQWCDAGLGQPAKRLAVATEILVDYMYRVRLRMADAGAPAYPGLFISFRSHFEGFAASLDDRGSAERAFAQRYCAVENMLMTLVPAYETHQGNRVAHWMLPWESLVERYFDDIRGRVLAKTLVTGMQDETHRSSKNLLASSFHEKVVNNKEYTKHAMKQPLFQTNRILLGLIYLSLFRLGMPLIERYFLCYALSRFIQERHDISAEQAFEHGVRRAGRRRRLSWLGLYHDGRKKT